MANKVLVYTDGSYSPESGVGGWGALVVRHPFKSTICGSETHTNAQRMELLAVASVLESLEPKLAVDLFTDAQSIVDGVKRYQQGWRDGTLKHAVDLDLWDRLFSALEAKNLSVNWQWVRAHSSSKGNVAVDQIARAARRIGEDAIGFVKPKKRS